MQDFFQNLLPYFTLVSLVKRLILPLALGLVLTPLVKKFAFFVGAVDKPNQRKVHTKIMPRMGGIAIYLAFAITLILTEVLTPKLIGLLLGSSVIILVGGLDDTLDLSPKIKIFGQMFAALILVGYGYQVTYLRLPFVAGVIDLGYWSIPFTVFWLIGVTNAINLIDGLDGLAAGTSGIAILTMGVIAMGQGLYPIAIVCMILFASILGFLRYNFNPASIFMGDSGSLFLGFVLGAISIAGLTKITTLLSVFLPIVVLGVPIVDTLSAILRRKLAGKPISVADKKHLHHRLLELNLSHRQVVLVIYAMDATLGIIAIGISLIRSSYSYLIIVLTFVLVAFAAYKFGIIVDHNQGVEHTEIIEEQTLTDAHKADESL
ncbi:MAG: MraY family glycosyltransferase [Clostridia bacterium]